MAHKLLWSKLAGWPMWPSRYASIEEAPVEVLGMRQDGMKLVYFFGSHDYAWLKEANLKDFETYKELYNKKPKHTEHQVEFKLAIKEALAWRKSSYSGEVTTAPHKRRKVSSDLMDSGEYDLSSSTESTPLPQSVGTPQQSATPPLQDIPTPPQHNDVTPLPHANTPTQRADIPQHINAPSPQGVSTPQPLTPQHTPAPSLQHIPTLPLQRPSTSNISLFPTTHEPEKIQSSIPQHSITHPNNSPQLIKSQQPVISHPTMPIHNSPVVNATIPQHSLPRPQVQLPSQLVSQVQNQNSTTHTTQLQPVPPYVNARTLLETHKSRHPFYANPAIPLQRRHLVGRLATQELMTGTADGDESVGFKLECRIADITYSGFIALVPTDDKPVSHLNKETISMTQLGRSVVSEVLKASTKYAPVPKQPTPQQQYSQSKYVPPPQSQVKHVPQPPPKGATPAPTTSLVNRPIPTPGSQHISFLAHSPKRATTPASSATRSSAAPLAPPVDENAQFRALEFAKLEQFHRLQTIELLSKHQERNKVLQELVSRQSVQLQYVQMEKEQQDAERKQLQNIQSQHRALFAQQLTLQQAQQQNKPLAS